MELIVESVRLDEPEGITSDVTMPSFNAGQRVKNRCDIAGREVFLCRGNVGDDGNGSVVAHSGSGWVTYVNRVET